MVSDTGGKCDDKEHSIGDVPSDLIPMELLSIDAGMVEVACGMWGELAWATATDMISSDDAV